MLNNTETTMDATKTNDGLTKAAEDAVSVYLHENGPVVAWDDSWFTEAYEIDSAKADWPDGSWIDYRDAAKAAHKRSQSAELARDPREDESQWRTETT